jgi:transposase-like protein
LSGQLIIKRCPKCKSKDIWKAGFAVRKDGKVQLYQCKKCGSKFRENNVE